MQALRCIKTAVCHGGEDSSDSTYIFFALHAFFQTGVGFVPWADWGWLPNLRIDKAASVTCKTPFLAAECRGTASACRDAAPIAALPPGPSRPGPCFGGLRVAL